MSRFGLGFTGSLSGNDQYTKILLHMDGANGGTSFVDSNAGGAAKTWTASSATTSTVNAKFGGASMLAATGKISTPDSADFTLGTSDFTVDLWLNRDGNNGTRSLFGQLNSTATSVSIGAVFTSSNTVNVIAFGGTFFITSGTITDSNWHHFALVRNGSLFKVYFDGVADAVTGSNASALSDLSSNWCVGAAGDFTGAAYSGYLDEFRLSVGIARWTANFTPPNQPYG